MILSRRHGTLCYSGCPSPTHSATAGASGIQVANFKLFHWHWQYEFKFQPQAGGPHWQPE